MNHLHVYSLFLDICVSSLFCWFNMYMQFSQINDAVVLSLEFLWPVYFISLFTAQVYFTSLHSKEVFPLCKNRSRICPFLHIFFFGEFRLIFLCFLRWQG
jgi:hypothetical protein